MNPFVEALTEESKKKITENGMSALNTTDSACLDLFSTIGALREKKFGGYTDLHADRAERLFDEAVREDKLLAARILFFARDIRAGLGERDIIRHLMAYAAKEYPEIMINNLHLIGLYGRFDDLYAFIGTPLENAMWKLMKEQFEEDRKHLSNGEPFSLLAKWIKTPDASSKNTRKMGILTAGKLGYSVYEFKRILRAMRKELDIVERRMSANEWLQIKYPNVPSRAMMIYRRAFDRHDPEGFKQFINEALEGRVSINSATLFPYDIVEKILYKAEDNDVLEAQWRQLPDYVDEGHNILVMADVSGSMWGRPLASSIGLAIYFAEHNTGDFKDVFMTFSSEPQIVKIKGRNLKQKVDFMRNAHWMMSTNIEAAFDRILDIAVENDIDPKDMPEALIVITDMEFDSCVEDNDKNDLFCDVMRKRFQSAGYRLPHIVFWNVYSRHDTFHTPKDMPGVTLISGQSATTFRNVIKGFGKTPYQLMLEVLNSERYAPITVVS